HIFLPYKLMNYDVDSWKTRENENEIIGEMYEVFIRSSERLNPKEPRTKIWQRKGTIFSELNKSAPYIFKLCDGDENDLEIDCAEDDVTAVKITTVFQQEQPGFVLWKSGIAIALWIRQECPNFENKLVLNKIVQESQIIGNIPKIVKKIRKKSIRCKPRENHIGYHLCLLWDDPNLIPPTQKLTHKNI
ncbi:MAG: hypothetical protein AAGC64_14030, partial [Bacteroidota bacterium]